MLAGIDLAAHTLGIDVRPLLARFNIRPDLVTRPGGYIDYRSVMHFMDGVATHFNCPHWGFLVGTCQRPVDTGIWGLPIKLAPDLETAINHGIKYYRYLNGIPDRSLEVRGNMAKFSRGVKMPGVTPSAQTATLGIVQMYNIIRDFCAPDWRPARVTLIQTSPPAASLYEDYFRCPVTFEHAENAIYFPRSDLRRPMRNSDPELLKAVLDYLDRIASEAMPEADVVGQVRVCIKRSLGTSNCNLSSVAQQFHAHPRKLQRELGAKDATFNQLLSEERMACARHMLESSTTEVFKLSNLLGYGNPSAFSRAFTKTYGISPENWRKNLLKQRKNRESARPKERS